MEIIITTINGTFIVPKSKEAELLAWLQYNAVLRGQQKLGEIQGSSYSGQQLINE